jgi:Flp pilus assembly protein TadD
MAAAFADSLRAEEQLRALAADEEQAMFLRASALQELGNHLSGQSAALLREMLNHQDPLMRFAAVQASHGIPGQNRLPFLLPLLVDPVRLIRAEAAARLADSDLSKLPPQARPLLEEALGEFRSIQLFNADRAESHLNLGVLALQLGDGAAAERSYRKALELSPDMASAYVNLADLYRQLDREEDCAAMLLRAQELEPDNADVQHALGLQRIRVQKPEEALQHLQKAVSLNQENVRYAYVLGVALHSLDQRDRGIEVLQEAHQRHPADLDVLAALASFEIERGNQQEALSYVRKMQEQSPNDPGVAELLRSIEKR